VSGAAVGRTLWPTNSTPPLNPRPLWRPASKTRRGTLPVRPGRLATLGQGLESLWFDTFLHADDIRQAAGRSPELGDGLLPSVSHISQMLTDQGWRPVMLRLDGIPMFPVSGGGQAISGDPMTFILISTGRAEPSLMGLDESVNIYR
jgi:hypothetical protein